MARLRFQVIFLAICLIAVLVVKHYVNKYVEQNSGVIEAPGTEGPRQPTGAGDSMSGGVTVEAPEKNATGSDPANGVEPTSSGEAPAPAPAKTQ